MLCGTTLVPPLTCKGDTLCAVTGASRPALLQYSGRVLQGDIRPRRGCLAPNGSSLKRGGRVTRPHQRIMRYSFRYRYLPSGQSYPPLRRRACFAEIIFPSGRCFCRISDPRKSSAWRETARRGSACRFSGQTAFPLYCRRDSLRCADRFPQSARQPFPA